MFLHFMIVCLVICFIGLFINAIEAYEQDKNNNSLEKFRRVVKVRQMQERETRIQETNDKVTSLFVEIIAKATINGLSNLTK